MRKRSHEILLIIISILAIITSLITLIDGGISIYKELVNIEFDFAVLSQSIILDLIIDFIFAILEIFAGINLLKSIISNQHFDSYKQIPGLIRSIITPFFAYLMIDFIFIIAFSNGTLNSTFTLLLIIVIAIYIISSSIRNSILKRKMLSLNIITIMLSILSLLYMLIEASCLLLDYYLNSDLHTTFHYMLYSLHY